MRRIAGGVAVLPSAPVPVRSNDVDFRYRPSNDLLYLTGFCEPGAVCVLAPQHAEHRFVLFVRPRDPEREVWDGQRAGVEGAVREFGADAAFPIAEFEAKLPEYLRGAEDLWYRLGASDDLDRRVSRAVRAARADERKGVIGPWRVCDPGVALGEMRLRKSEADLGCLRRAARVTAEAHARAMAATLPGRFEYEIEAELVGTFRRRGAEAGYEPVVAGGANATILHYRDNRARLEPGQLLLIDSGAEIDWYSADVTRTFPVGRRFSGEQRAIYELVLESQRGAIDAVRPGETLEAVHGRTVEVIARGLVELGIIAGPVAEAVEKATYKKFFMHRTSHWLGMDVHDAGAYFVGGKSRALEPGMVLTVEPGVYVAADATDVDARWRGIGVRVEDDLLVTAGGHENLTSDIPKSVTDLEALRAGA